MQNKIALNKLGTQPDFKTGSEFQVGSNFSFSDTKKENSKVEIEVLYYIDIYTKSVRLRSYLDPIFISLKT